MNPSVIPTCCGLAMTAVLSAGISHWWSVREFASLIENGVPIAPTEAPVAPREGAPQPAPAAFASNSSSDNQQAAEIMASSSQSQKDFFNALVDKMNRVEAQNRDLLDQLAETNRDMMKLEFRVDTHSQSFRPLPVIEDKPFSTVDQNPGVLPPRAEQVRLPTYE